MKTLRASLREPLGGLGMCCGVQLPYLDVSVRVLIVHGNTISLIGWDGGHLSMLFIVQGRRDRGLSGQGIKLPGRHHLCLSYFADLKDRTWLCGDPLA